MIVRKRHIVLSVSLVLVIAALALHTCHRFANAPRVASFNLNQFPERTASPEKLFSTILELDSPIVALQEVGDLRALRAAARSHLGPSWRVRNAARCTTQCVGYLYDSKRVEVVRARTHDSVRVHHRGRPAYEINAIVDGAEVTLVNVHLKAKPDGLETRLIQLDRLAEIVAQITGRGESVVVLGDFNSIGGEDRAALERFGAETRLSWATAVLKCSHYFDSRTRCVAGTLDHAFTSHRPRLVEEAGACKTLGCAPGNSCPTWVSEVSDHCPFVVQLR